MEFDGKVAIVTGASKGIGREITIEMAKEGIRLVVNYNLSNLSAEDIVQQIQKEGGAAIAVQADVSNRKDVEKMVKIAIESFGHVDILVNNAAFDDLVPFLELTEELWDRTLDVNLKGAFLCAQAAAKEMIKVRKGRIINISSVHGLSTREGNSHYAASKGGLNALTRGMALDLARYNITVNAVCPGLIEVERYFDGNWYDREEFASYIPVKRVGLPKDIARTVLFLASDNADYITGQVINVDGGITAEIAGAPSRPLSK